MLCISVVLRKFFISKKMNLHLLNIGKYILIGKRKVHNKLTNSTIIINHFYRHVKKYMIDLFKFSGNYWYLLFHIKIEIYIPKHQCNDNQNISCFIFKIAW